MGWGRWGSWPSWLKSIFNTSLRIFGWSLVDLGELGTPEPINLDMDCIQVVCEVVDCQANAEVCCYSQSNSHKPQIT